MTVAVTRATLDRMIDDPLVHQFATPCMDEPRRSSPDRAPRRGRPRGTARCHMQKIRGSDVPPLQAHRDRVVNTPPDLAQDVGRRGGPVPIEG
jgi:hypothetical protein